MVELQGIPVSPGVAIGPALVLDADGYRIPRCLVAAEDAADEYARLRAAVDAVSERLETSRLETSALAGEETGARRRISSTHKPDFLNAPHIIQTAGSPRGLLRTVGRSQSTRGLSRISLLKGNPKRPV